MSGGKGILAAILSVFSGGQWRNALDPGPVGAATPSSLDTRIALLERDVVRLRDLSRRLMAAHDDQRRRIARDLHDHLSQQLALLAIGLQELGLNLSAPRDALAGSVDELWRQTVEISSDVHNLTQKLHPAKLETLGLVITMRGHCRDVSRQGVRIHFSDRDVPAVIPPEVALCLFRILEESVANVIQHSTAAEAYVTLESDGGELVLRIVDAGRGFETGGARRSPGLGLISMPERLHAVGGTLAVVSDAGRGTTVEARVPGGGAGMPIANHAAGAFVPSFRPRVH